MPSQRRPLILALSAAALLLGACSSEVDDPTGYNDVCTVSTRPPVVPEPWPDAISDPIGDDQQLWDALSIDDGTRVSATLPSPDAASITQTFSMTPVTAIFDRAKLPVLLDPGSLPNGFRVGAVLLQLTGIDEYYFIPVSADDDPIKLTLRGPQPPADNTELALITADYASPGGVDHTIDMSVRLYLVPENEAAPGASDLLSSEPGRWMIPASEAAESATLPQLSPQSFASGLMQVTLIWDQANDVDLWLTEPDDHKIFYGSKNASSGAGALDRDDVDGYGAENIYLGQEAYTGEYKVQVNYYSGSPTTNYTVLVKACGDVRTFSGTLYTAKETDTLLTFDWGPGCTLYPPPQTESPDFFEEAALCDTQSKE